MTGAARGMGEAHARRLVEEGASVMLTDILDREGETVIKEFIEATPARRWGEPDEVANVVLLLASDEARVFRPGRSSSSMLELAASDL